MGKPLMIDMTTKNQITPRCAKVKVEVDLAAKLPQWIRINKKDDNTRALKSKWIKIQYNYMSSIVKNDAHKDMKKRTAKIFI